MTVKQVLQGYPKAKRCLIEQGRAATEIDALPPAQVVLIYSMQIYDKLRDENFKWLFLPASEAGDKPQEAYERVKAAYGEEIIPLGKTLLPSVALVRDIEMRSEWRIAVLRIFEAMRLYAGGHDGHWPDHLTDIREVPIPTNPVDGKPFLYERRGDKAVLTVDHGPKYEPWRYEITLKSKVK